MKKNLTLLFIILSTCVVSMVSTIYPQSVLLGPPTDAATLKAKLFYSSGSSITLNWNTNLTSKGAKLKIGTAPGNYSLAEVSVSQLSLTFQPKNVPISTGRYYALITNSTKTSRSEIEADCKANPSKIFSNEIQFVVESPTAPYMVGPRGSITTATPQFQWNAVAGVKAYWLIVSSTPFTVVTLPNGEVSVQGANILWNYLTTANTVQYGDPNYNSPYDQPAPPLVPGVEYSYTVLNVYDEKDVSFASSAFGGVVSFIYKSASVLAPPKLLAPADKQMFYATDKIVFQWDRVPNVNNYTFYLYQRVQSFAGNEQQIDIPVWNTTTTNTMVEFPAKQKLTKGKYVWYVVAKDNSDAGNTSVKYTFDYIQSMGVFSAQAKSASDGNNLIGFELKANAINGGVSTANPFLVNNSSTYKDSLVAGTYEFTAKKADYYDSSFVYKIEPNKITDVRIVLRPYNSVLSGKIIDKTGNNIADANVRIANLFTGQIINVRSGSDGSFTAPIPQGNYSIQASKPGYLASDQRTISLDKTQLQITTPFVITLDNCSIAGKVLNDMSLPVQLATVTARQGTVSQSVNTDNSGNYNLSLSSGQWTIEITKVGFVAPQAKTYSLTAGEQLQNQNFILSPKANQISGIVTKPLSTDATQTGKVPFAGVTITATPLSGNSITVITNTKGEYSLSLKSGAWTITAAATGYTADKKMSMSFSQDAPQTLSGVDFLLSPNPCVISGNITLPDGSGLGDVTISYNNTNTLSLQNGSYSLSLPAGSVTINAQKIGYVSPSAKTLTLSPGQKLTGVDFQLIPNAGTISGKVLNGQSPVPDAVVSATNGTQTFTANSNNLGEFSFNLKSGTYTLAADRNGFISSGTLTVNVTAGQQSSGNNFNLVQNIALISGVVYSNSVPINNAQVSITDITGTTVLYSTLSDINGAFSVTVEAGKSYILNVSGNGFLSLKEQLTALTPSSKLIKQINLVSAASSISGKVTDEFQLPVSGVKLYKYSGNSVSDSTFTNASGEYFLGFSAGQYQITTFARGYKTESLSISINAGEQLTNINFILKENFSALTGKITDSQGAVLAVVNIEVSGSSSGNTVSDQNGNYLLSKLFEGVYQIKFTKQGYSEIIQTPVALNSAETKQINIALTKASGKASGVITTSNGATISGASVIFTDSNNNNFYTTTNSSGAYEALNLPFGEYTVSIEKNGYTMEANATAIVSVGTPEITLNISNLAENNAKIMGKVIDETGSGIEGVDVQVSGSKGSGSSLSDNSGLYSIANLQPGEYTVTASKAGYTSGNISLTISGTTEREIVIVKNSSRIIGVLKDQKGSIIKNITEVQAVVKGSATGELFSAMSDQNGTFVIDGIPSGKTLQLNTEIHKPGYVNDTVDVVIPVGNTGSVPVTLVININNSVIKGSVNTGGTALKITNLDINKLYAVTSLSDGSYELGYLPAGSYRIAPTKSGYSFTPQSRDITVGVSDTVSLNFVSSSNVGSIKVTVKDIVTGTAISGSNVTIVNRADNFVATAVTDVSGECSFNDLPASKSYVIRASMDTYTSVPDSVNHLLSTNESFLASFSFKKNSATISGYVYNARTSGMIKDADVKLTFNSTGATYLTKTNDLGRFVFNNIRSGQVTIHVEKSGYTSSDITYSIAEGETKDNMNFALQPSNIKLTGRILYANKGVAGIKISASSSSTVSVVTDNYGIYSFDNLAIKTGTNDTTVFNISITETGYLPLSHIVQVPSDKSGTTVQVSDFILPSGQIILNIGNGIKAMSGVKVDIAKPEGQTISFITTESGRFESDKNLQHGLYRLSITKDGYLRPNDKALRIELSEDTSTVNRAIVLPYSHNPLTKIYTEKAANIRVSVSRFADGAEAKLHYKKKTTDSYSAISMIKTDTTYEASIPAQTSQEDIMYYVEITEPLSSITYTSKEYTVTSIAVNMLSSLKVTPEFQGLTLRKNDTYELELTLRNGLNELINDKFKGTAHEGKIKWSLDDPASAELSVPYGLDSTYLIIKPLKDGTLNLKVEASLKGAKLSKTLSLAVADIELKNISISGITNRLSNKSKGTQFTYSSFDTLSRPILLGDNLEWSLEPREAGSISPTGFFKPSDSTYIGYTKVLLTDKISGKTASYEFSVFAEVSPYEEYLLTDKQGLKFTLSKGSVTHPIEVYMSKPQFGPAKKYYTPAEKNTSYTISDKVYNLKYISSISLPGDSLTKPASVELPLDKSLEFSQGMKQLGLYDPLEKYWRIYDNCDCGSNSVASNSIFKFGEFAIVSVNEPLGLHNVRALPTPFSPEVAPLKIGYILTTNVPPAKVTIRIYNIRGELVKTILEDDLQYPNRYGSSSSPKEILWDGKTDDGNTARNGRYIIQTIAKDATGEKSELTQIAIIK